MNIVNKPIKLNIYSNTCPDLTLIDLPGITRIPIYGKFNLILRIRSTNKYIRSNQRNGKLVL